MRFQFALLSLLGATMVSVAAPPADAEVTPASPFTDHMVLQRGAVVPVWGTAGPGENVSVTVAGQTQTAVCGADGKWMVRLKDLQDGGPHTLTIAGNNTVKLQDVYAGEVWLCSGQSNMDFTVAKTAKFYFAGVENEPQEVAAANYPLIRMFSGDWSKAYTPQASVRGAWKVCTPENVREFSAVGYFFARDLHKSLNVPVGIITMTYGASTAEAWVRREALQTIPEMAPTLEKFDAAVKAFPQEQREKYAKAYKAWQAKVAEADASGGNAPRQPKNPDPVEDQHNPTVMFNGMIAPIIPYGIKGVLWYQGESVVGGREGIRNYPKVQETLVRDWRTLWGNESLPFYICQLAALNGSSELPEKRAYQETILRLPHTGMAVTIDIGDPANVHPKNKQAVGDRLCRIALADAYGQNVEFSGPVVESMKIEGGVVRLTFSHAEGGLIAKGLDAGEVKTFQVAGSDGKFVPATAKIDGNGVLVSSSDVGAPTAVRYAWEPYPEGCNLYNKAGLPAAPFKKSE